jgi:hypothetical protein
MRHLFVVLLIATLTACATPRLADEPADLLAPGERIRDLLQMGWKISAPIESTKPGLPEASDESMSNGQTWASFTDKLSPGDELRPVRNNAGIGYAIFRGGVLLDMFLTTIF